MSSLADRIDALLPQTQCTKCGHAGCRPYAEAIAACVKDWVPLAFAAFEDYRMGGVTLSAKAIAVLKRQLKGEKVAQEDSGMSKGEWREFMEVWG